MKLLRLAAVPFALLAVAIVKFVSRWKLVRFQGIWTERIGHMIGNTECYLCDQDENPSCTYDIWIARPQVSNRYILKKYRRLIHLWPAWWGAIFLKVLFLFPDAQRHVLNLPSVDRDVKNAWAKHAPHIRFTRWEEFKGQRLLRKLGIPKGAKWVCLFARDSSYLKVKQKGVDFSYHDHRDFDVNNCVPAVGYLISQGYYVIRMGEVVDKYLAIRHSRVIDWPGKGRTEFGDLYLGAKCAFFLGSPSGFLVIPQVFGRPLAIINSVPLHYTPTWNPGLMIWKHHVRDGKRMTPKEIRESGAGLFMRADQYKDAGITLEENSPQEIFDLAKEMCAFMDGKECWDDDQGAFWHEFMEGGAGLHGAIKIRVGSVFLRGYQ